MAKVEIIQRPTALGVVGTKNPPIDADKVLQRDSTAADALVTSTWTQIKAFLKTYWDTLYEALGSVATHAGLTTGVHGVGKVFSEIWCSGVIATGTDTDTARNMLIDGNYLYGVAASLQKLVIYDISNPSLPIQKSLTSLGYAAVDVRKKGNYLFVSCYNGVQVWNVSDVASPVLNNTIFADGKLVHGMFLLGNYLYCCKPYHNIFAIVDVTDPTAPIVKGSLSNTTYFHGIHDVHVEGNYAYITNCFASTGEWGLTIVNVSDVNNPAVITGVGEGYKNSHLYKLGGYLYVGTHGPPDTGMTVWNVSTPATPSYEGRFFEFGGAFAYWIDQYDANTLAITYRYNQGLYLIDISTPTNPIIKTIIPTIEHTRNVVVEGNYLYISTAEQNPYNWRIRSYLIGSYDGYLESGSGTQTKMDAHARLTTGIHGAIADEDILVAAIGRSNFMMFPTNAGWSTSHAGSGGGAQTPFYLSVSTGTTASSQGLLCANPYGFGVGYYLSAIDYNKKLVIVANIGRYNSDSESIARLQLKSAATEGALAVKGIGLKAMNYALWGESYGTSLGEVDLATTLTDLYDYQIKIVHTPGVSIKWYVNGVLKGTQTDTAKIPSGYSGTPSYAVISIINGATGGVNCYFFFMQGKIWQAR